jgi:hypothetical protein
MKISTGLPLFNTPVDPQGTENQSANAIFHAGSASLTSHVIDVSETPIIVKAYGFLTDASTITVHTVTTGIGGVTYSSPMVLNGHTVQLSNRNNTLVIDLTGKYRFVLSDGLHTTTCVYHESGLPLWSFGLAAFAEANGILQFIETLSVKPVVDENIVQHNVKLSTDFGNLLTIHGDENNPTASGAGLYYGPVADKYGIQYVSSVSGNDNNDGLTKLTPIKTLAKALEFGRLPDGTAGIIYLKAGERFNTYPNAAGDAVTSLTPITQFVATAAVSIGNRSITFRPYDDPASDAILAYNSANGTSYYAYSSAQTIWPTIVATVSLPNNTGTTWYPIYMGIGVNGQLRLEGINFRAGQTGTVNPAFNSGAIVGSGQLIVQGGHLITGNTPILGQISGGLVMNVTFFGTIVQDHTTPSTPQVFASMGTRFVINSPSADIAGGVVIVPTLPYTSLGDNTFSYLAKKSLWYGLVIFTAPIRDAAGTIIPNSFAYGYDTRSYYNLSTAISINLP